MHDIKIPKTPDFITKYYSKIIGSGIFKKIEHVLEIIGLIAVIYQGFSLSGHNINIENYISTPQDVPNLQGTMGPQIKILDGNTKSDDKIAINNKLYKELYMMQVGIKNVGQKDIENLDVRYKFSPTDFAEDLDKNFDIFALIYNTSPPGLPIELTDSSDSLRKYSIKKLHPTQGFSVSLLFGNKEDKLFLNTDADNFNPDKNFHIHYL